MAALLLSTEKRKQLYCCSSFFGHRSWVYGIKYNQFFPDLDSSVLWGTGEVDWNLKRIVFHHKMLIVTISGLFTLRPVWTCTVQRNMLISRMLILQRRSDRCFQCIMTRRMAVSFLMLLLHPRMIMITRI